MNSGKASGFEAEIGRINASYFFREFTFSSNTFKPDPKKELELADKIVWLDDLLIVSQLKERNPPPDTMSENESRWFRDEVLKKATRQVRDTISYLKTYPHIEVCNNRGHAFDIARARVTQLHKLVVYDPHPLLPVDCAFKKYHRSRSAGVIHLIHSAAYLGILNTLVTPIEIGEYLAFREVLINEWEDALSTVSEKAVVGQYVRNLPGVRPSAEFGKYVEELEQKDKDWDISRIIHLFAERQTTPDTPKEIGYKVLRELAKLYRTEMAEFKKRFRFSMDKALADAACLPHRFTTSKDCGFVFIPLKRKDLPHRHNLLLNFTALNKYEQKLGKCIGLTFIAEGEGNWCDVQWCPMEFPWAENEKLKAALNDNYPFRPVKERRIERYGLADVAEIE